MDRHEAGYVLVVDDDADVRTMIERVLGRAGFRVLTAQDGEAALQILRGEQRIDVVLTDLQMPRMSGVALLRSIRELDQDVPVIVLTGNASLESAIAVVEHGGFRYLEKPIENERLQEMVRAASATHRLALLKREALELAATGGLLTEDRAELGETFERALDGLWIAFQPIVEWPTQSIFGYEALVRSSEDRWRSPLSYSKPRSG
ncbi:MAG TPA: response regulator [Polyangiaceae bacterium]|nr:response regulator [Polyangiaceae bacterium]